MKDKKMHRLIEGDTMIKINELIDFNYNVDCIICDPSYGMQLDIYEMFDALEKFNCPIILLAKNEFAKKLKNIGSNYQYSLYYDDKDITNSFGGYLTIHNDPIDYEFDEDEIDNKEIMIFSNEKFICNNISPNPNLDNIIKEECLENTPYPIDVLKCKAENKDNSHPTQKPIELIEYLLKAYTNKNDVILDFSMGMGNGAIACENLNRVYIGIESDSNYFNKAVDRIINIKRKKR